MPNRNWTEVEWQLLDARTRCEALRCSRESDARQALVRLGRSVLKKYSTSFFIVTRFLPPRKRAQVDMLYAGVRYPDEVVDTFDISAARKDEKLSLWCVQFDMAMRSSTRQALLDGVPVIVAGLADVMRESEIPARYYHDFLNAMRADVYPRRYETLDDLVENYIYGSAIVVGYFLAYIYGASSPSDFGRALQASRRLGIALQLTNFIRDVAEDRGRGRLYLPLDMLGARGIRADALNSPSVQHALSEVVRDLALIAQDHYVAAQRDLDAFSPDCRLAIEACIRVYGELNDRVAASQAPLAKRQSVSLSRKISVLPASKYWRLPLAYMGLEPA
ncbi:MAG: phytoene/squalene synthase family protein [Planctomycetes bacterium]|nr:phytoene/squalene synthase family protein [Planctomycetota bacterium]